MSDNLIFKLRSITTSDSPLTLVKLANQASDEIEKLRSLVSELLPFMLNDMEDGLRIGPFDHEEEEPCGDCIWFKEASYWKKRFDTGEFNHYF